MTLFIPITKVDTAQRLVYGTISEEVPDKAGEILDYDSAKPAFQEWSNHFHASSGGKSLGNLRAMHGTVAAGKFTSINYDDNARRIEGVAKIVDDDEWSKVLEGVYTGFSIGGGYARRWQDSNNPGLMRYTPTLSEVSLVDNPAVPTATFEVVKGDGTSECRKFNSRKEETMNSTSQVTSTESDNLRITELLDLLRWLERIISDEEEDNILPHIYALQDFLTENEDSESDDSNVAPESDLFNEEDDATAQAYAGELARMVRRATHNAEDPLHKKIEVMASTISELRKRVEQMEAMPVPAKGVLRAVDKMDDRAPTQPGLEKISSSDRVRELMKIALSNPVQI